MIMVKTTWRSDRPLSTIFCVAGGAHFLKDLHNLFRKKIAFQYPVSQLLEYKMSRER